MREIIFDTETTGLDPESGHRIVEIGCIEVVNLMPTGENFHKYLNPEREVPASAVQIHGLTSDFLKEHPVFGEVAGDFLEFVGDATLVAHNADFDMRFLNWELRNIGMRPLPAARAIDTLAMARSKFPGAQHSLDALCRRFGIDNSNRSLHGALLDARILSEVYLELSGGRQTGMDLDSGPKTGTARSAAGGGPRPRRHFPASKDELARHEEFITGLTDPVWSK